MEQHYSLTAAISTINLNGCYDLVLQNIRFGNYKAAYSRFRSCRIGIYALSLHGKNPNRHKAMVNPVEFQSMDVHQVYDDALSILEDVCSLQGS